jgi:ABC-2 type transport system ATP-binding protein
MLEVRSLTKRFNRIPAVDDVSFVVRPYEVLGYLGPNGSGKSTTANMLAGLLEPSQGQVYFNGRDIKEQLIEYKRRLGYVPEEPYIYPHLSGLEYLQLVGRLRGLPEKYLTQKAEELLRLFGLQADRHALISAYSKGMRQKVLIIAALLHDPDILIFDEPLSGLDVTSALVFRDLVSELARQGKTILYSSHVLEVVEKICSRVIILRNGSVVADDSVERLRDLMKLASLENIFAELVLQRDTKTIAGDIVQAMRISA